MSPPCMWVLQPVHEYHTTDPFSFCYRPLWVTLCSFPQMPACGNWWQNWSGDCMTSVWWWQIPGVSDYAGTTGCPLPGNGMGDAEKPWWDMVFLLIVLSITTEQERIFSLIAVWAYPCQACYTYLADVVCKLLLLMDSSTDWVHVFIQLNEVLSHAPLSSMGHISAMIDSTPLHGPSQLTPPALNV